MPLTTEFLTVGDVIEADGSWRIKDKSDTKAYGAIVTIDQQETVSVAEYEKFKESPDFLGGKQFLVTETKMAGGGTAHGSHDIYPDGHRVTLKQLDANKNIDENGITAQFYQSGCFNCTVKKTNVVGKMAPTFAPFVPSEQ